MEEWLPPVLVVMFASLVVQAIVSRSSQPDDDAEADGREEDLRRAKEAAVEALRALELEKDKLDPADYERERSALVARGAQAMRQLDGEGGAESGEGESGEADQDWTPEEVDVLAEILREEREKVRPEVWTRALDKLGVAAAPAAARTPAPQAPSMGPEWRGAFYALAVVALLGGLVMMAGDNSVERRGGAPMTGNQSLGDGSAPMAAPTETPAWALEQKKAWEETLAADPNNLEALNGMTWIGLTTGDLAVAQQNNQKALNAAPKDNDARVYRGVLAALVGLPDKGLAYIDEVLADAPNHDKAVTYKGLLSLELGRPAEAIPALEKALQLQPDNPAIRESLAKARRMVAGGGAGASGSMPPNHPPSGAPPNHPPAGGDVVVSGTALVDDATWAGLQGRGVLYVSVRDPRGGPPLAALKLPPAQMTDFTVTTANAISMGGAPRPFPEQLDLTVRIDLDGNAMTRSDAEPAATRKGVSKGTTGLKLSLK